MSAMASASVVVWCGLVDGGAPERATPPSPRRVTYRPVLPIATVSVACNAGSSLVSRRSRPLTPRVAACRDGRGDFPFTLRAAFGAPSGRGLQRRGEAVTRQGGRDIHVML